MTAEDPDEEEAFGGWRSIEYREVALLLAALIVSLLIWVIFIYAHKGS